MNELMNHGEIKWHKFGPVQLYARRDENGKAVKADAIDEDEEQVKAVADHLQKVGYGVMRERACRGRAVSSIACGPSGPAPGSHPTSCSNQTGREHPDEIQAGP